MTTQRKRCGAITKKGTPCKRFGDQGYNGLCVQHGTKRSLFKAVVQPVKNTAEIGANVVKIAGGVIATVTFVSHHWGAIKHALSTIGICFVTNVAEIEPRIESFGLAENELHQNQIDELAQEAKDLTAKSTDILLRQAGSPNEGIELQSRFADWFRSLPEEVQQKAKSHVGESTIDRLLS